MAAATAADLLARAMLAHELRDMFSDTRFYYDWHLRAAAKAFRGWVPVEVIQTMIEQRCKRDPALRQPLTMPDARSALRRALCAPVAGETILELAVSACVDALETRVLGGVACMRRRRATQAVPPDVKHRLYRSVYAIRAAVREHPYATRVRLPCAAALAALPTEPAPALLAAFMTEWGWPSDWAVALDVEGFAMWRSENPELTTRLDAAWPELRALAQRVAFLFSVERGCDGQLTLPLLISSTSFDATLSRGSTVAVMVLGLCSAWPPQGEVDVLLHQLTALACDDDYDNDDDSSQNEAAAPIISSTQHGVATPLMPNPSSPVVGTVDSSCSSGNTWHFPSPNWTRLLSTDPPHAVLLSESSNSSSCREGARVLTPHRSAKLSALIAAMLYLHEELGSETRACDAARYQTTTTCSSSSTANSSCTSTSMGCSNGAACAVTYERFSVPHDDIAGDNSCNWSSNCATLAAAGDGPLIVASRAAAADPTVGLRAIKLLQERTRTTALAATAAAAADYATTPATTSASYCCVVQIAVGDIPSLPASAASAAIPLMFSNALVGGGVLTDGALQEEIAFVRSPECLPARLLCARLGPAEVLIIRGARRLNDMGGYGRTLKWRGLVEQNHAPSASHSHERRGGSCDTTAASVVSIDAAAQKPVIVAADAQEYSWDDIAAFLPSSACSSASDDAAAMLLPWPCSLPMLQLIAHLAQRPMHALPLGTRLLARESSPRAPKPLPPMQYTAPLLQREMNKAYTAMIPVTASSGWPGSTPVIAAAVIPCCNVITTAMSTPFCAPITTSSSPSFTGGGGGDGAALPPPHACIDPSIPVLSGAWGAGAFGGARDLRCLVQLMAAMAAGRSLMLSLQADTGRAERELASLSAWEAAARVAASSITISNGAGAGYADAEVPRPPFVDCSSTSASISVDAEVPRPYVDWKNVTNARHARAMADFCTWVCDNKVTVGEMWCALTLDPLFQRAVAQFTSPAALKHMHAHALAGAFDGEQAGDSTASRDVFELYGYPPDVLGAVRRGVEGARAGGERR